MLLLCVLENLLNQDSSPQVPPLTIGYPVIYPLATAQHNHKLQELE